VSGIATVEVNAGVHTANHTFSGVLGKEGEECSFEQKWVSASRIICDLGQEGLPGSEDGSEGIFGGLR
jgi:hypothetical protein